MENQGLLLCYNKGCGQKFNPNDNKEGSCCYHPGVPVFHDALKGWSCCDKRRRDFTEFLNIPGCSTGLHSNEKPIEAETEKTDTETPAEIIITPTVVHKPLEKPMERPSTKETMVRLKNTVGASLQQELEKQLKEMCLETDGKNTDGEVVKPGTSCKNAGCTKEYKDETTNTEICTYHAGVPIFHEGMKYWSCCKRKTSDFGSFLGQEGCTTGIHLWFKKEPEEKKVACRVDWHQTGSFVIISIFAKLTLPEKSWVETNQVSTKVKLVFEGGKKQFDKLFILQGVIDPDNSTVKMVGTKVEINLKKLEPGSWSKLQQSTS